MASPLDFMGVQPTPNGGAAGVKFNGTIFLDPNFGLVLQDQSDGKLYSVVVNSGQLVLNEITL